MLNNLAVKFAAGTLILAFIVMIYIGYLAFYPFKTIEPRQQPYTVVTKQVHPGENVIYVANVCRYTDVQAQVARQLIGTDGSKPIVPLPTRPSKFPEGCAEYQVPSLIPVDTPPGRYKISLSASYEVNPIRTITVNLVTEEFEVILPPVNTGAVDPATPQTEVFPQSIPQMGRPGVTGQTGATGAQGAPGERGTTPPESCFVAVGPIKVLCGS